MAFANPNYSDVLATTIENRSGKLGDNVTKNNAVYAAVKKRGNIKPFSGGSQILQEISFQENGNFGWFSGYDLLPMAAADVITAAQYAIKQAACPVIISGLEEIQNAGKEAIIDLLEQRMAVAEATMINNMCAAIYSDGTGYANKQLVGLVAAIADTPTSGVYGGIDRGTWSFWRNFAVSTGGASFSALGGAVFMQNLNKLWANLVRGTDRPDLFLADNDGWTTYLAQLQNILRVVDAKTGDLGFPSVKFMDSDFVLDGGIGGFLSGTLASHIYAINTKYLFLRPAKGRNFVPLSPEKRTPLNQDAHAQIIGWAGNMTCSAAMLQGVMHL